MDIRPVTQGNSFLQDLAAIVLVVAQFTAYTGCGQVALWALGWRPGENIGPRLAASVAAGYGVFGLLFAVLGHLHLFRVPAVLALLTIGVALAVSSAEVRAGVRRMPALASGAWRADWIITLAFIAAVGVLVLSAAAPPRQTDELTYHWASPLWWAGHHGLVSSPYKYSNGIALAEIQYTVDAVFGLSTAAHLLDLGFMLLLTGALALVLGRIGLPRIWAAALVLASPMILFEAPITYTDIIFAALSMCALVAVLFAPAPRRYLIAGAVVAFAASVKSLALLAVPGFLWIDWCEQGESGLGNLSARVRPLIAHTLELALPLVLVLALWMLHTWLMVHRLFLTNQFYIAAANLNPVAPGRVPTVLDVVTLPFLWVIAGLFGDSAPYGNRIGVVALIFVPVTALLWRRASPDARQRCRFIGVPALLYLVADVVAARTRFNIYGWLLFAAAALVLPHAARTDGNRFGRWLRPLLILAVGIGLGDGMRKIFFPHIA
jgi:hypothetical protein